MHFQHVGKHLEKEYDTITPLPPRRSRIRSAMTTKGWGAAIDALPAVGMTWLLTGIVNGNACLSLGWARRPRPTWRRGACQVRQAVDVGLDSLVLSHHGERTRKPQSQMPAIAQASVGMT